MLLIGLAARSSVAHGTLAAVAADETRAVAVDARIRIAIVDEFVAGHTAIARIAHASERCGASYANSIAAARRILARIYTHLTSETSEARQTRARPQVGHRLLTHAAIVARLRRAIVDEQLTLIARVAGQALTHVARRSIDA